jgi:hypothetical protein
MAVKPFFSFSIDYGDGRTVLPQPRSATAEEKAARKARDIAAGAQGRADRALKNELAKLEKSIDANKKMMDKLVQEATGPGQNKRRGKPIVWDGDSECFSDLRYSPSAGGVFATFIKGGAQYFYPCSRSEASEWLEIWSSETGEFFNASGLRD